MEYVLTFNWLPNTVSLSLLNITSTTVFEASFMFSFTFEISTEVYLVWPWFQQWRNMAQTPLPGNKILEFFCIPVYSLQNVLFHLDITKVNASAEFTLNRVYLAIQEYVTSHWIIIHSALIWWRTFTSPIYYLVYCGKRFNHLHFHNECINTACEINCSWKRFSSYVFETITLCIYSMLVDAMHLSHKKSAQVAVPPTDPPILQLSSPALRVLF